MNSDYDEEYDKEDATYGDEGLDDEQDMILMNKIK